MKKMIIGIFVCFMLMIFSSPVMRTNVSYSKDLLSYESETTSSYYEPGTWLLTTKWGQHQYYNDKTPTDSSGDHYRLGCWSVAIGQIMRFHELQSHGEVIYFWGDLNTVINNLDAFEYDWNLMPDELNASSSDDEINHVSQLLYDTATIIQKDWGTDGYILNAAERADELVEHFEYIAVQTEFVINPPVADIIEEIDHHRPCMLYIEDIASTTGHAVALDGYEYIGRDFFVHLNFGWTGTNDGFYNYDQAIDIYDNNSLRGLLFIRISPCKPHTPVGPSSGVVGVTYNFTAITTTLEKDVLYYKWDFGDGTFSDWLGRYNSGEICEVSHTWKEKGAYRVMVKAKSVDGWESPWSNSLPVTMPYSYKPLQQFFNLLFQWFPHAFPVIRQQMGR